MIPIDKNEKVHEVARRRKRKRGYSTARPNENGSEEKSLYVGYVYRTT